MDTLPEECLLHLLSFVSLDRSSLYSLMFTSTTLFRLVAPILYRNPFGLLDGQAKRRQDLLYLLLRCTPDTLQSLPSNNHGATLLSPPLLDYLSFYKVHSEKHFYGVFSETMPLTLTGVALHPQGRKTQSRLAQSSGNPESRTKRAAASLNNLVEMNVPTSTAVAHNNRQGPSPPVDLHQLRTKIHLGLLGHTPENIHTISFSIHKISILEPLVNRLSGLVHLKLSKRNAPRALDGAVNFITIHRRLFTTLQEITLENERLAEPEDLSCLLQTMVEPRVIDVSHWKDASRYISRFPLQRCNTLIMHLIASTELSELNPSFLSTFTALHTIRMPVFHQSMFSWAAARKGSANEPMNKPTSHQSIAVENARYKSIRLYGKDGKLVPALTDAADAFRESLRELVGQSSFADPTTMVLSWDWLMPCLTRLDLEGTVAVNFDLNSLHYCSVLEELRLNIARKIPEAWDVQSKVKQLSNVSHCLRRLCLEGYWDFPDSALKQTLLPVLKRLHRLDLTWCRGPTTGCWIELLPQLTNLLWLALSTSEEKRDQLAYLKRRHKLSVEIDIALLFERNSVAPLSQ
ncbi:hypothetical protein BX616_008330 [Lobosporangium transversale]|uniref:Uncharacterized protein n=1 Tax=Lobosporangium transversale TaxID=64571 RepID=A0A1Y2GWT4_9FUNG|nr:hypothetical protein BCR41DRAFT_347828 [Lobosporangium transversale]KAF9919312.1 hypothetical protein BX616_008330 [Lobosporangium transversale]ORZ26729.1 hypothetical protein BCR41DRAFT_347828 [Lobosporangium transversale]|eukprot:XP_021884492.1 hypothetical protein BCR41DRAFT_347828 [Lobosporangium transversale]